jgi:uncharacterized membrane protein
MWQWLRRTFITGFFVTVPLVVSGVALVWVFQLSDRLMGGLTERVLGRPAPEVSLAVTLVIVLAVGAVARNVFGRRVLERGEALLMHVPVFRTVYGPVKQLVAAFSPDNEGGFKRAVLVEDGPKGFVLGFVTKEFTVDRGRGPETLLAVYVPTNQLYLGHVMICAPDRVSYPDLTVEQAIRAFLTGGMGLPGTVHSPASAAVFREGPKPLD